MKSMYGGDYTAYFDSMGGFYSGFNVWRSCSPARTASS